MMISSKGRYALRAMIDLAEQQKTEYIPLKEIAERQNISQKYLESIMTILSKSNYIDALHGKGGGYRLNRSPKEYRVGDILRLFERTLASVSSIKNNEKLFESASEYRMLSMWENLDEVVNTFLDNVCIADLMSAEDMSNI